MASSSRAVHFDGDRDTSRQNEWNTSGDRTKDTEKDGEGDKDVSTNYLSKKMIGKHACILTSLKGKLIPII